MLLKTNQLGVHYWAADRARGSANPMAVSHVTISIDSGEVLGLLGESGSGKSSLGLALCGLLPATARLVGEIAWGAAANRGATVRRQRATLVPQSPAPTFSPFLRCGRQLRDVLEARGLSAVEALHASGALLDEVGLSAGRRLAEAWPHELSGGELQRLSIARSLATEPELLVADEITSSLDSVRAKTIVELIRALSRKRGLAVLWITHDPRELIDFADRVITMANGSVAETGSGAALGGGCGSLGPATQRLVDALPSAEWRLAEARP